MICQLLIPDLFLPKAAGKDAYADLHLPSLETLLARGRAEPCAAESMEAWLCRAFGVEKQQDWPVAPLTLQADGGTPGNGYWLRADPVHLRVHRDQLILADCGTFRISQGEAEQLTDALNRHFADEGLIFYPLRPERWYLRLSQAPQMRTVPLAHAAGKNISDYLPSGADGLQWHRLFNEMQMLLHRHPVNEAREARGEMPVNSLWLWGGGTLPRVAEKPFVQVWANEFLAGSLAAASGIPVGELPQSAVEWTRHATNPGEHLVVLDTLRGAAQYGDIYGWREALKKLEAAWLTPLLAALQLGRLKQLIVTAPGEEASKNFSVTRTDLWKMWRLPKPLSSYA